MVFKWARPQSVITDLAAFAEHLDGLFIIDSTR